MLRVAAFVLFLFALFEGGARVLLSIEPIYRRARGRDDASFRMDWVKQHGPRQDFEYKFYVYDPTRGWAVKPNLRDMIAFEGKNLNSNSKGLRGRAEYSYDRQPGKQRLLLLGDSYTFGDEVSDNETFAHYLGTLLPNTEVLNLGVSGYGHDQMLLYLQEEGARYRPDVVVVGYVWFDKYRAIRSFNAYGKPRFEWTRDGLRPTNLPILPPPTLLAREPYRLKFLDLLVILREKLRWRFGWNEPRASALDRALLHEIIQTSRSIGAMPVFVYLPVMDEVADASPGRTPSERDLLSFCQQEQIPCLFVRDRFQEEVRKGAVFNTRTHWGPNAHRVAAEAIRDDLLSSGLLAKH